MFKKVLEEVTSPISGKIQVISFFGNKRIVVDGLVQSGGLLKGVWEKGIDKLTTYNLQLTTCLILGLGGGTLAHLISKKWPKAKIVGIEIDKEIIRLGKKYFGLDKIPNLKIINADAIKLITDYRLPITDYQLVFLDLYLGRMVPPGSEKEEFLKGLEKILKKEGTIVINRLFSGEERKLVRQFIGKLEQIFPQINLVRTDSNLLIFLRKR